MLGVEFGDVFWNGLLYVFGVGEVVCWICVVDFVFLGGSDYVFDCLDCFGDVEV